MREACSNCRSPYLSIDVLLTRGRDRFASVQNRHEPRKRGRSRYTLRNLVSLALNMLTGFSVSPLRLASVLGLSLPVFGLAILGYVLGRFFSEGGTAPGFRPRHFSGAQLFAAGVMGEYFARTFQRTLGRPCPGVRDTVGFVS